MRVLELNMKMPFLIKITAFWSKERYMFFHYTTHLKMNIYTKSLKNDILGLKRLIGKREICQRKSDFFDLYSHQPFPSGGCLEKNDLPTSCGKPTSFEKTTSHWKKNFFSGSYRKVQYMHRIPRK